MARRPNSIFEEVAEITSKLPWWAGVILASVSFLFLHWFAGKELPAVTGTDGLYENILPGFLRSIAFFGQLVVPAVFLLGALISVFLNFRRKKLYDQTSRSTSQDPFDAMSWRDFEFLVGEYFRHRQFSVEETKAGADGGVDLIARKDEEKYLIQCKHWKTYKVGVKVIRELLGVMVGAGATGGIVVTSGEFTKDSIAFARANNITLLNGRELLNSMKSNVEFQSHPAKKLQNTTIVLAFLLLVILCCSVLLFSEMGTPLRLTISAQIKAFLPDNQKIQNTKSIKNNNLIDQKEGTDHTFTQQQIQKAMEEVLSEKKRQQNKNKETGQEGVEENYSYEIELFTGGRVYTDNATVTKDKVTYKNSSGIIVSINIDQIKTLKRVKKDD